MFCGRRRCQRLQVSVHRQIQRTTRQALIPRHYTTDVSTLFPLHLFLPLMVGEGILAQPPICGSPPSTAPAWRRPEPVAMAQNGISNGPRRSFNPAGLISKHSGSPHWSMKATGWGCTTPLSSWASTNSTSTLPIIICSPNKAPAQHGHRAPTSPMALPEPTTETTTIPRNLFSLTILSNQASPLRRTSSQHGSSKNLRRLRIRWHYLNW